MDESTGFYKAQLIRLELDELEEMKENVAGSADEAEDDPLADVTSDGSLSSSVRYEVEGGGVLSVFLKQTHLNNLTF